MAHAVSSLLGKPHRAAGIIGLWCIRGSERSIRSSCEACRMTKAINREPIYRRRRFSAETIELCVRWYITYCLSYRDLAAMMAEREVFVAHTTIMRWVLQYVPEYERRWDRFARPPGGSWRVDETAVAVRGGRHYLFRGVDKNR